MSTVIYGNVSLEVAKTNELSMTPVYTEDGVDYLFTKYTLDIDAVLNPFATSYSSGPIQGTGNLAPTTLVAIRHQLLQPRLDLTYSMPDGSGDDILILFTPVGSDDSDVNNGPKPISCIVREVMGSKTFLINWRVEGWIHECPMGEDFASAILSNRWSQEHHINRQALTTKITRGTAHFRINVLDNKNVTADHFRNLLLPVVSPGFQRVDTHVALAAAQNALQYTCIDEEVMTDLSETDARQDGSGIVRLEGTYGVSSIATKEGIAGGTTMAQIDLRAWGNKYASNWRMIQRCFEIILSKITIGAGAVGFIRQGAIRESIMDRYVEVMIGFQQTAPGNIQIGALRVDGLRKDDIFEDADGINPGLPNDIGTRGSAQEELLAAAIKTACEEASSPGSNPESGDSDSTTPYSGPPPAIHVQGYDELPEYPAPYSPPTQQYPYTSSRMDILYHKDEGLLAAPVAGDPNSSGFTPVKIFRLHPAIGYKVIEFTSERVGAMPSIPDPKPTGDNLTLLESELTGATPEYVDDGGTKVYRISGRYKYVFAMQTLGPGDSLDLGSIPWTTDPPGSNKIQSSQDYTSGIVDPDGSDDGSGTA